MIKLTIKKTKRGIQKMTLDEIRQQTQLYKNVPNNSKVIMHNVTNEKNIFKTC